MKEHERASSWVTWVMPKGNICAWEELHVLASKDGN